ncbi:hypothetical protein EBW23_02785 [bacterium]|nr:hypothetical protein [bacterium]
MCDVYVLFASRLHQVPTPENRGPRRPRREEESGRPSRPARPGGAGGRSDRPAAGRGRPSSGRPSDSRSERPARPGSRPAGRPAYGQSDGPSRGRPSADRGDRPSYGRGDSAGRGRPPAGRGRPDSGRSFRDDDRPVVPQTAAQRKADEVRYRTGGRKNDRDALPRNTQSNEVWKDEGSTRPARGRGPRREEESAPIRLERDERRASAAAMAHVEATVAGSIIAIVGERASKRLIEKLALALDAFERGRYQDAKKIIIPISRDCPGVELIHEIAGLSMYRMGQWRDAADHLEQARALTSGSTLNHPVLSDCYRALMRYDKVDELWKELKDASPDPTIVAEGRIVAASALADQGDIQAAVRLMQQSKQDPAKVREHHLREWYVLADLYDRSGDVVQARTIFQRIAKNDADFTDVRDRLETLGSR